MCGCKSKLIGNKKTSKTIDSVTTTSKKEIVDCTNLYTELQQLSLYLLEMINGGHENSTHLSNLNNQIRSWVRNLRKECPPEEERQVITDYINNEYTEYKT